jgi:hypothetical protein
MIPEFECYRRIPGGLRTTNKSEDEFLWSYRFASRLEDQMGGGRGKRILGTRHAMEDGSKELRASETVLRAASLVLRNEGHRPQRKRQA